MHRRRILIAVVGILFGAGTLLVLWSVFHWPSPRLLLVYGFPPAGGPTGRTEVHRFAAGPEEDLGPPVEIVFVELAPGYVWIDHHSSECDHGNWLGRICAPLGFPWGEASRRARAPCRYHVVHPKTLWIGRTTIPESVLSDAAPGEDFHSPESIERALNACSGKARERYRLATDDEFDLAYAHDAIECDPDGWEVTFTPKEDDELALITLRTPGPLPRTGPFFASGVTHYRIVWEPGDGAGSEPP